MKRWIAVVLVGAFASGCGGGGRFLPTPSPALVERGSLPSAQDDAARGRHPVNVRLRMTIPRRHRGERIPLHPSTISPLTQSVGIGINGGAARIFNAMPSSPGCVVVNGATVCTFAVSAPP